jgi:hypothetical protein
MHTDTTLTLLSQVTTDFGNSLRIFKEKTCKIYPTRELERERAARMRRQEKGKTKTAPSPGLSKSTHQKRDSSARQPKQLNLKTYKYHALGDYTHAIRRFGTTDSYSSQRVSFPWVSRVICANMKPSRVNGSTEPQKGASSAPVADQYHSNYRGLKGDSVASA